MTPGRCLVEGWSVAPWRGKEQLSPLWKGLEGPLRHPEPGSWPHSFFTNSCKAGGGHIPTGQPLG